MYIIVNYSLQCPGMQDGYDQRPVQNFTFEVIASGNQSPGGPVHLVRGDRYRQGKTKGQPDRSGQHGGTGTAHGTEQ